MHGHVDLVLLELDPERVEHAAGDVELALRIVEGNEVFAGFLRDLGGEGIDLLLEQLDAGLGHVGIDLHAAAQPGDEVGELLLLRLQFRLHGDNARMVLVEAVAEEIGHVGLLMRDVAAQAGNIGLRPAQALEGGDELVVGQVDDGLEQHVCGRPSRSWLPATRGCGHPTRAACAGP